VFTAVCKQHIAPLISAHCICFHVGLLYLYAQPLNHIPFLQVTINDRKYSISRKSAISSYARKSYSTKLLCILGRKKSLMHLAAVSKMSLHQCAHESINHYEWWRQTKAFSWDSVHHELQSHMPTFL